MRPFILAIAGVMVLAGCAHEEKHPEPLPAPGQPAPSGQPAPAEQKFDLVARPDFNRVALELDLPLFWITDANANQAIEPAELAVFWGLKPDASAAQYVQDGAFTQAFRSAYAAVGERAKNGPDFRSLPGPERIRRALVVEELAQGRQTLVHTDLRSLPDDEKKFVHNVLRAAAILDRLYEKQLGTAQFQAQIPQGDTQSQGMFFRNHGFRCTAPKTQGNPNCSAIPNPPQLILSGLYPQGPLQQPGFCESLGKRGKALVDPFTAVVEGPGGQLAAKPYHDVWPEELAQVSALLKEAADGFGEGKEPALKAYLLAASQAFLDDDWVPADEAWAKMNAQNSRWYLRIAPDEVYAEPCSTKAMFHVSFGSINQGSLKWQAMLDPLKTQLEGELAKLSGPPYKARSVTFKLPDFMDVVLNAGDSRNPMGATIGQSLPNFGPVANEGRGRTVAMVNLYTDPDSLADLEQAAKSLFCQSVMADYTTDPEPLLMDTVLHEAAHNLGPAHQYKVKGKDDRAQFGGPLASTMEELKAQTASLYFVDWLAQHQKISEDAARKSHVRSIQWALGHISRGMYDEQKHPRNYSQLAAIQVGYLLEAGALTWKQDEPAANGTDKGCFAIDFAKFRTSAKALMKDVGGIKARGDRRGAQKLLAKYVDVQGDLKAIHDTVTERYLRAPKASFVYSVVLE